MRAAGAGETAITVTPAGIGNAIFDVTGASLRNLPLTPVGALHYSKLAGRRLRARNCLPILLPAGEFLARVRRLGGRRPGESGR